MNFYETDRTMLQASKSVLLILLIQMTPQYCGCLLLQLDHTSMPDLQLQRCPLGQQYLS